MPTKNTEIDSLDARKRLLVAESDLNRQQLLMELEQSRLGSGHGIARALASFFSGGISSGSLWGWMLRGVGSLGGLGKMLGWNK